MPVSIVSSGSAELPILVLACLLLRTAAQDAASSEQDNLFTPPCAAQDKCNRSVVQFWPCQNFPALENSVALAWLATHTDTRH